MPELEDYIYLGKVGSLSQKQNRDVASIEPLFRTTRELSQWVELKDREIPLDFPNRGLVAWLDVPATVSVETFWQFRVESQYYEKDNPRHEAYRAKQISEALEVLDLRNFGGDDAIRQCLTIHGLRLPYTPAQRVYLWINAQTWIGPLHLKIKAPMDEDAAWLIEQNDLTRPLPLVHPAHNELAKIPFPVTRWFLSPNFQSKIKSSALVDWRPDKDVLRHVLANLSPSFPEAVVFTKKTVNQLVENLHISDGVSASLEEQRIQRAGQILAHLERQQQLLDTFSADLLRIPAIQRLLETAERETREKAKVAAQTEISAALEQWQRALDDKQQELTSLEQEIERELQTQERLQQETATLEETLEKQKKDFEVALQLHIAELMKQPEQVLSEMALFRAAFGNAQPLSAPTSTEVQPAEPTNSSTQRSMVQRNLWRASELGVPITITEHTKIRKSLSKSCNGLGFAGEAGRWLHAAFLAGAMPLVTGSNAFELLKLYATCVTGGRLLWIPISPTLMDSNDLLGKVDPTSGWFIPHAGGLLDLLRQASKPEKQNDLFLVVLDGVNRAAIDAYLQPLLASFSDRSLPSGRRALPLFHPAALSEDGLYRTRTEIAWPANVLLAGTLSDGAASITPPASLWDKATLLSTEIVRSISSSFPNTSLKPEAAVPAEQWTRWQEEINQAASQGIPAWLEDFDDQSLRLSIGGSRLTARLDAAFKSILEEDINGVIAQCLVPQTLSTGQKEALSADLKQSIAELEKKTEQEALNVGRKALGEKILAEIEILERMLL